MEPFRIVRGVAAPLMRQNVDTDVIIRVERLIGLERDALGPWAFESWRYGPDGAERADFLLNQAPYRHAPILLAGDNFGCGSSREGAVWALAGQGFRCVIAPSFGDIFYGNCFQNGVLPINLPRAEVESLAEEARAAPDAEWTIDLIERAITSPTGRRISFGIDPQRREMLLDGLDQIGVTRRREAEIAAFQSRDRRERPWIYFEPPPSDPHVSRGAVAALSTFPDLPPAEPLP
jgi:3-isopropylmalate/(R)-2-methylmalate dehydratase small subunit